MLCVYKQNAEIKSIYSDYHLQKLQLVRQNKQNSTSFQTAFEQSGFTDHLR